MSEFKLNPGRAAFFKDMERTSADQPAITGRLVLPEDAKAGDTVYVVLWDGNDAVNYLSGTAKVGKGG